MDHFAGVDFDKGCYVGQEVVSRMQHRGTARTRIVPVRFEGAAPEAGIEVFAGERVVGHMGSAASRLGLGLARLRIDRVIDAAARGEPILAGGVTLTPDVPDWAVPARPGEGAA
jgi:folate-binding Fe-S cluster repair protein YgfZ